MTLRLIWNGNPHAGENGVYIVKFISYDPDRAMAWVDFGVGDFCELPISELKCWETDKPLATLIAEAA